ncbi:MAG: DUF501 domain-containing protein [Coriobacteriia bacterium]|nr:DUF501 domain-containing protein [Coriobacteriia bacterium]
MSRPGDEVTVALQTGREPRDPWRVGNRCDHGYPSVILSPSMLGDGTRFPTWAWLTCPHLVEHARAAESAGDIAGWNARLSSDAALAARLALVEDELRAARSRESAHGDCCGQDGIAGQRVFGHVKCLHAHAALYLAGLADPVGEAVVVAAGATCADNRCAKLLADAGRDSA